MSKSLSGRLSAVYRGVRSNLSACALSCALNVAHRLCEVTKKPPLCPFCRSFIEGFHCLQACN